MADNPYRSPTSPQEARSRPRWFATVLRACMGIVGTVVITFGALVMLRPNTGVWYVYPAAVSLVGGGACLVWWACERSSSPDGV